MLDKLHHVESVPIHVRRAMPLMLLSQLGER